MAYFSGLLAAICGVIVLLLLPGYLVLLALGLALVGPLGGDGGFWGAFATELERLPAWVWAAVIVSALYCIWFTCWDLIPGRKG
ncbi:MAG: hypothetical protein AAGC79_11615 [Pseudomonadota bacterium]